MRTIPFYRLDITDSEISEVADTLRSGWITTGAKTKLFEARLRNIAFSALDKKDSFP